jgi:hypothetical protein
MTNSNINKEYSTSSHKIHCIENLKKNFAEKKKKQKK